MRILVSGAGGFIGGHLVNRLLSEGHSVRAVDIKPVAEWWQAHTGAANIPLDLRIKSSCESVCDGIDQIYNLAADMGGIGFIERNKSACMISVLINTHLLMAARTARVERFFFASSACVYSADRQTDADVTALKEGDAYPAMPEDGYGWEKLFSERMCRHFMEDHGLECRVARFHNVYGPHGTWEGGREKAPAALCRKAAECLRDETDHVEIWGDGEQTRSFTWIDDCIEGTRRLMDSDVRTPLNLGSSRLVSINTLVDIVESLAGIKLRRTYDLAAPKGVRGRNSDNTLIRELLGWEPRTPPETGMAKTWEWIKSQVLRTAA